jgi:hypothetical protein
MSSAVLDRVIVTKPSGRTMMSLTSLVRVFALSLVVACGGSDGTDTGECFDLCTEAQAGDCTSVTGNCTSFCEALDGVQDDSGCTSERSSYQSCLAGGSAVCDNDCDGEETALTDCLTDFCSQNLGNPDCQTLINSF